MEGNLNTGLKEFFNKFDKTEKRYSSICKVISIDNTKRTCQLEPINGDAERKGRLQASIELSEGIYIKPTINSYVLLSFINNQTGVITQFSEISSILITIGTSTVLIEDGQITFNEGSDYAVRYSELETAYNQLKSDFDTFVSTYNSHIHITTATIGATPTPGVLSPTVSTGSPSTGDITGAKISEIKMP